jgi:hypothetical protein
MQSKVFKMLTWLFSFLFLINVVSAEEGRVSKIAGDDSSYLVRNNQNIVLKEELPLEQGDEIYSMNSVVLIYLQPTTQMSLAKKSQIKITQNLIEINLEKEKSTSVIEYIKGIVRLQVTRDDQLEINQKVVADGVSFAVRGTEFEISREGEDVELDVVEGEVEVSSPYVQTFVPEIVKANEGFKFNKKNRQFQRRKFRPKFTDHPRFADKNTIRQKWKQKSLNRKVKNINRTKPLKKSIKSQRKKRRNRR